jgi:SPP1 gp7 family putative phage head morphogenesis protein
MTLGPADLRALFERQGDIDRFLRERNLTPSWNWFDLRADAHARSFTAAKAARLDVLQELRDALVRNRTERDFIRDVTPRLQALGWWGRETVDINGTPQTVQLGSPHRLRTIYRANMRAAYNAARYRAQLATANRRPFWQWVAVMDGNTRPTHAALNGRVFRFDDPFWRTFYPPLDYGCRCRVRALTEAEVEQRGLRVSSSAGLLDEVEVEAGTDRLTGEVIRMRTTRVRLPGPGGREVAVQVHPAWANNPALVPWFPDLDRYDIDLARWFVRESIRGPAFANAFNQALQGSRDVATGTVAERVARIAEPMAERALYPVAVLAAERAMALGVRPSVTVSELALIEMAVAGGRGQLGLSMWLRVPEWLAKNDYVVAFAGRTAILAVQDGREWLIFTAARPDGPGNLRLIGARRGSAADARAALAGAEIIVDGPRP